MNTQAGEVRTSSTDAGTDPGTPSTTTDPGTRPIHIGARTSSLGEAFANWVNNPFANGDRVGVPIC